VKQNMEDLYDFWFNNHKEHIGEDNYGEKYYGYEIFKNILSLYDVPDDGYLVIMGSHNCVSLELLANIYGRDRCIGFDLFNPTNNDMVRILDCNKLGDEHNMPIAFCHNDLGSFPTTPQLKIHGQKWAAKNIVPGGIMLSRNNLNSAKFKSQELMLEHGFENHLFTDIKKNHPDAFTGLRERDIEGHMFSIKK